MQNFGTALAIINKLRWCEAYPPCELQLGGRGTTAGGGRYPYLQKKSVFCKKKYVTFSKKRHIFIGAFFSIAEN